MKIKLTAQRSNQQIKSQINRLKVKSQDQKIEEKIKSWINKT